jgi:hypothetical protein
MVGRMLTSDAFQRARAFLFEYGRPLDRERFRFHFESGSGEAVVVELARFQNADGGFGHGLEPDLRAGASSAIATSQAFRLLREIGRPDHEVARRGLAYLLTSFDRERSVWEMVPPAAEEAPHAPWLTYSGTEKGFNGFVLNPTAELLGALYDYAGHVPDGFLAGLTPTLVRRAQEAPDQMEIHDFGSLQRLAETENLPDDVRSALAAQLLRALPATVSLQPSTWEEYNLQPLRALGRPDSFLAPLIAADVLAANAEFWERQQLPDGSWQIPWDWASNDADAWAQAEREWKCIQIVDKLLVLKAFGRL